MESTLDQLPESVLTLLSPSVKSALENDMRKNKREKILKIHPYAINVIGDGRYKTRVYDNKQDKVVHITATTEDKLFEKLYVTYFISTKKTFNDIFELVCQRAEAGLDNKARSAKTVREWRNDYNRFFSKSDLIHKPLDEITISDICSFLDEAHRGGISKQRHGAIGTIIRKVYHYSARYLNDPVMSLFETLDYNEWRYEPEKEKDYYTELERAKILTYIDSLENPSLPQLAVGTLFELSDRNGESRALRFDDFNFSTGVVRIQATAVGRHREDHVKKNSPAGKRNIIISDRLKRIYYLAKEISWSDEYLFVTEPKYCHDDEVLISERSVCRALSQICKAVGVRYLPPHQIRFSNVTQMIKDGRTIGEIQKCVGHTTPEMTLKYMRDYVASTPIASIDNDKIIRTFTVPHED